MRMMLGLARYHSVSQMFANLNVPACQPVVRNVIFKFMCNLKKSENAVMKGLVCPLVSDAVYTFKLWMYWYRLLYVNYVND